MDTLYFGQYLGLVNEHFEERGHRITFILLIKRRLSVATAASIAR